MKLVPLPPKPRLLPPGFWFLAYILAFGAGAMVLNVSAAYSCAMDDRNGMLVIECFVLATLAWSWVHDVMRLVRLVHEWHVLRCQWDALHELRKLQEQIERGKQ